MCTRQFVSLKQVWEAALLQSEVASGSRDRSLALTGQCRLWEERTGEPPAGTKNYLCGCEYSWILTFLLNLKSAVLGSAPGTIQFTCNEGVACIHLETTSLFAWPPWAPTHVFIRNISSYVCSPWGEMGSPPDSKSVKSSALKSSQHLA